jgi:hypothetical protein
MGLLYITPRTLPSRLLPLSSWKYLFTVRFRSWSFIGSYVRFNSEPPLPFTSRRLVPYPLLLSPLPSPFHRSTLERMGRKWTAEDYNRTAEKNGWVPGAHEKEDRIQQTKDEPNKRYKQNQQETLDQRVM